jgi:ribonuclease P protein component
MLPKSKRLGKSLVPTVVRQGRPVAGNGLSARILRSPQAVLSRFAVVVSTKVLKSAVARNRLRRQIHAILGKHWSQIASGAQVVIFINHKDLAELAPAELSQRLLFVLQQGKILE